MFYESRYRTLRSPAVNLLSTRYYRHISRRCVPWFHYGAYGAGRGSTCLAHENACLHYHCRIRYGNKCFAYLGLYGLNAPTCQPPVTIEGIPIGQWIRFNKKKRGDTCPIQFKFPGINKSCAPPSKKVAGKA